MLAIILLTTITLSSALPHQAASSRPASAVEQEILQMDVARRDAIKQSDVAALARIYADSLVVTGADGRVATKADELALNQPGNRTVFAYDSSELSVQVYGDTAILTGRNTVKDRIRDQAPREATYRFTQVWLRLDGRWQIVAVHVSARVGPEARSE